MFQTLKILKTDRMQYQYKQLMDGLRIIDRLVCFRADMPDLALISCKHAEHAHLYNCLAKEVQEITIIAS